MGVLNLQGLLKHLDKYGEDGVLETAVDEYKVGRMTFEELATILVAIDKLHPRVKHRKTTEQRLKALLGIKEEDS